MRTVLLFSAAATLLAAAACDKSPTPEAPVSSTPTAPANAPSMTPLTPCPTCKVHVVTMTTNEVGNFFEPKELEAHEGDIIRFKLVTGVHNVNFLPDSNAGKSRLPKASDFLQLPGQTVDVLLNFGSGHFYFQCDPHAALGMIGRVEVEGN